MDDESTAAEPTGDAIAVAVRPVDFDAVAPQYVNIIHVNNDPSVFHVVFSQAISPIITGPEDSQRLIDQGFVPAKVIARLILSPAMMEQTIEVLQTQFERYREQQGQSGAGKNG